MNKEMFENKNTHYAILLRDRCEESLGLKVSKDDLCSAKVILDAELGLIEKNGWGERFWVLSEIVRDSVNNKAL